MRRATAIAASCAVLLVGAPAALRAQDSARRTAASVVILVGSEGAPYREALAGFAEELERAIPDQLTETLRPSASANFGAAQEARVRELSPALVVAIGSQAASWAASEFSEIPLVATMLLRADILAKHPAATGVQLEFPVESELEWLARMLPKRRIGALFDPAQNAERIRAAHRVAQRLGLELVSVEVASPRDLPDALEALSRRAQVLWGINDETVYTPATAKAILTFSYRNRIPLTGLSTPWVKAGALYALDRDYRDIGRQCGELAARVLRGERAASIPPETPRKLSYALNLKAARHMNLDLSSAVVQGAALRFD